ncbi:MAG TPA: hypothetical protein VF731_08120 [Solirubrobacterales bacterium]
MAARAGLAAWLLAAVVALALPQAAAAVPLVGKDGRIHACYRVKGKPKGMLRAVHGSKARCHKGERKVSWLVAGVTGASGANGAPGAAGQPGGAGTDTATLETRIGALTQRVEALEKTLAGVSNAQLLGALADVKALCTQTSALTGQVDALGSALGGLELGGLIPVGLELLVPALPAALPAFACP